MRSRKTTLVFPSSSRLFRSSRSMISCACSPSLPGVNVYRETHHNTTAFVLCVGRQHLVCRPHSRWCVFSLCRGCYGWIRITPGRRPHPCQRRNLQCRCCRISCTASTYTGAPRRIDVFPASLISHQSDDLSALHQYCSLHTYPVPAKKRASNSPPPLNPSAPYLPFCLFCCRDPSIQPLTPCTQPCQHSCSFCKRNSIDHVAWFRVKIIVDLHVAYVAPPSREELCTRVQRSFTYIRCCT